MAKIEPYTSDLTDIEWEIVRRLLPVKGKLGRPPRYERRLMLNAIFYITRTGCPGGICRMTFPNGGWFTTTSPSGSSRESGRKSTPPCETVSAWPTVKKAPTAAAIDSQSVKMAGQPGERGFDAGKKVLGRKRHLLVDTLGLILAVVVHSAGLQDRDGAKPLLQKALWFGWLRVIWADGGYAGQLAHWFRELRAGRAARLEIVRKLTPGFKLLPHRWVVERTFAWLSRYRRLSRDYEVKIAHSEVFIYIAASRLMLRRLAKKRLA